MRRAARAPKPTPSDAPSKVIGYVRVSTDWQVKSGLSLDAQRLRIEQYAGAQGLELIGVEVEEGESGGTMLRPKLELALSRLRAGEADGLVVVKLDRLTRSIHDLVAMVEEFFGLDPKTHTARRRLFSVEENIDTSTPIGRFFLFLMGILAQMELEQVRDRTRTALAQAKRRGILLGAEPLGLARSGVVGADGRRAVEAVEGEQKTLRRIMELADAAVSYRQIARTLTAEGHQTKRGGKWGHETVAKVIERERERSREGTKGEDDGRKHGGAPAGA